MLRNPTDQQRVTILGRTGSGKSQFSCGLLSTRNFHEMPWIIIDYKGEDLVLDIYDACNGGMKQIDVKDKPPKEPGVYHMRLVPKLTDADMDAFLWKCHAQGHIGLFIDEGFALPQGRSNTYDIILTQGRSLHIPVIQLYQRPVWMSRFAIAQTDYFAAFKQHDLRDLELTNKFVPPMKGGNNGSISVFNDLPDYHCLWHDVGEGNTSLLAPAPSRDDIIQTFTDRLKPKKKRALL